MPLSQYNKLLVLCYTCLLCLAWLGLAWLGMAWHQSALYQCYTKHSNTTVMKAAGLGENGGIRGTEKYVSQYS
ncbi:hypothetical protein E2C01_083190 [Portunus trituberculatus]|uniref:Uncharacterized protein n=1 Tax=Portunus trituberculatus TaxID=210409 RepID=A0A5B7IUG7_PORTR|nr:hypothetical protein [Portunus trituberculatus]